MVGTDVEIISWLKKIHGKFLKDEGIYVVGKPQMVISSEYHLTVEPIETDVLDLSTMTKKIFFIVNEHDVDAYYVILSSYAPSGVFVPITSTRTVPAKNTKIGVMSKDVHRYIKIRAWTGNNPSEGYFAVVVIGIG